MPSSVSTWLITGTSAGLGRALAQHVLEQGHNVISVSRHADAPSELSDAQTASNSEHKPTLHHLKLDFSSQDPATIRTAISKFLIENPDVQVDVLVNNAGVASFHALETFPDSALSQTFAVNFFSPLWLVQALLPHMRSHTWRANGHEKVIMNISSTQGLASDASEAAYDASKHALEGMSKTLAAEVAPFGIRALVVNLGSLRTDFANAGSRNGMDTASNEAKADKSSATTSVQESNVIQNPYDDPTHPVHVRKTMCLKLANTPDLARGDVHKTSCILFSAVVKRPRSIVNTALENQRQAAKDSGSGKGTVERLVLGMDGYSKLQAEADRLKREIDSCAQVVGIIDCEDLL